MSDDMAQKADDQIEGGIRERDELLTEIETLKAERDRFKTELEIVKEDLSVARQSLYEVVDQRNAFASACKRYRQALERAVVDINNAITQIRKWININSSQGPDLQDAGNFLAGILSRLPNEQNDYLAGKMAPAVTRETTQQKETK